MKKGFVYLVGAGPGRADLITVRGAEVLKAADCMIYDKLANPALLQFVSKDAEIIHVPKRIGEGSCTQDEINKVLVEKALAGKTVVRLKGGDPCIFGRVAEELAVLIEAGVDFEIVPGVTAAVAVSSYTGIMLTDREYSSQVTFVTGREAEGKEGTNIDWDVLARFPGTIVFYMGMGTLESTARSLIDNGKPADTPAAVIANATFPSQRVVRAPLERINETCEQQKIKPPAIVVIGAAAASDTRFDWFTKRPLFGRSIVMTRDAAGNADFAAKIIQRGGNPLEFETIRIKPLTDSNDFLRVLAKISQYDWVVFTSGNGVTTFFDALEKLGKDARVFAFAKIAAIGDKTADRLGEFGIKADFVPGVFTSRELGKQLIGFTNLQNKKILLLRSQLASNELVETLAGAGAEVDNVAVYTAISANSESGWLADGISKGTIDWLTFASPSSVDGFFEQFDSKAVNSSNAKVASIGPVTSERLKGLDVKVDVTAREHTLDGLLDSIEEQENKS
ncbi:MAG: uroporphyrinogen-III C-methyltransferase [Sedimentisphaerales bacterium]|nr:uroporphyrinogen-III C-methyltransferase [Sedimentisphaerales bacterium]